MIFAAALNKANVIVPIVEGEILRIFNGQTNEYEDFFNPAQQLTAGRRGAALTVAEHKGVTAFVSPPETFCERSYDKARHVGIRFVPIASGVTFDEFLEQLKNNKLKLTSDLPSDEIVPSN